MAVANANAFNDSASKWANRGSAFPTQVEIDESTIELGCFEQRPDAGEHRDWADDWSPAAHIARSRSSAIEFVFDDENGGGWRASLEMSGL